MYIKTNYFKGSRYQNFSSRVGSDIVCPPPLHVRNVVRELFLFLTSRRRPCCCSFYTHTPTQRHFTSLTYHHPTMYKSVLILAAAIACASAFVPAPRSVKETIQDDLRTNLIVGANVPPRQHCLFVTSIQLSLCCGLGCGISPETASFIVHGHEDRELVCRHVVFRYVSRFVMSFAPWRR